MLNDDKKINFKNFSKEYFPILSLFIYGSILEKEEVKSILK